MSLGLEVRKGAYYDSVTLMRISKEVKKMDGIQEVLVGMGTELNKELSDNLGLSHGGMKDVGPNDFFIAVLSDEDRMEAVVKKVDELLNKKQESDMGDYTPPTLESALRHEPSSNMVLISLPGRYAFYEAKKALEEGLHVMLFSDNVTLEEEKKLKDLAKEKGLLMMGPDCGTAIINHVPLAFANVISKGPIGIVGASGTGTQEVSVLIDKLGSGISQVIGTGGRDLKKEIGGTMMIEGIRALAKDPETKVIVLISKPPDPEIAEVVLREVQRSGKPAVINFIGSDGQLIHQYGLVPGWTLEDTASKAVALVKGLEMKDTLEFSQPEKEIEDLVAQTAAGLRSNQKYLRGLYTGGTLCDEAIKLISSMTKDVYSNIPMSSEYLLENIHQSYKHTCIDLGDDDFTVGRAHPMIDPTYRLERLMREIEDDEVALILMDFVIGYGAHPDPVGEMLPGIEKAQDIKQKKGFGPCFIASVCGTDKDPQSLEDQEEKLRKAGVAVMPSNAQAVRLAMKILEAIS